jgi:site-specific DNA recombinase
VSVLGGAPYGYRYVRKSDTTAAHYEITESEAQVVRMVFRLYTREDYSIGSLARHLSDEGIPTRTGKGRWDRSVVWAMLRNPAYVGRAAFGKTGVADRPKKLTRPIRQQGGIASPHPAVDDRPREEWIEILVPAIVDETTFALAAEQLERNKQFARRNTKDPTLLQGLLVCRQCGYTYYRCSTRTSKRRIYYYRCLGSDDYRWEGGRVCSNRPVRQDHIDGIVWEAVVELLADPALVLKELDRRLEERRRSATTQTQEERLRREVARHQKAIVRLIEAYQEELISLEELRAPIPELRSRENAASSQLQALQAQLTDQEAYLKLAESLESFLARLEERAQALSVEERQKVLRLVVREVRWTVTGSSSSTPSPRRIAILAQVIDCVGGVSAPLWAHNGRELFYVANGKMNVVRIHPGPPFSAEPPRVLFTIPDGVRAGSPVGGTFAITPDDRRFLMVRDNKWEDMAGTPTLVVVQSFFDELRAKPKR